ncbi:MAG: hypothetical protein ACE5GZ_12045 [Gammaproteobacteria bacterium]
MDFEKSGIRDNSHVELNRRASGGVITIPTPGMVCAMFIFFLPAVFCVSADEYPARPEQPESVNTEPSRSIADYRFSIRNLEIKYSPYDPRVGEQLLGLGLAYQLSGKHKEAVKALNDAFLISRLNTGLNSLKHIDILELLLKNYIALENTGKINEVLSHMYWIYRRNYEDNDPRWLPILKRLYFWHTENAYLTTRRAYFEHRDLAFEVYDHASRIIFELTGKNNLTDCFWDDECCATLDECTIVPLDATHRTELSYLGSRLRKRIAWHARYGWD